MIDKTTQILQRWTLSPSIITVYIVGGYVRDKLLGLEPNDHDYVVLGVTHKDMIEAGFHPVGVDFPIYLHPITNDEFALARGRSAFGINPGTLITDLKRRDFTINAMARRVLGWTDNGHAKLSDDIVDPFNGQRDIRNRTVRPVSHESIACDPIRMLRACRLAARYNFQITEDARDQIKATLRTNPVMEPNRIWTEIDKSLKMTPGNDGFWQIMISTDVISALLPSPGHLFLKFRNVAKMDTPLTQMSTMCYSLYGDQLEIFLITMGAPKDVIRMCKKIQTMWFWAIAYPNVSGRSLLDALSLADAIANPGCFRDIVLPCLRTIGIMYIADLLEEAAKIAGRIKYEVLTDKEKATLVGPEISRRLRELQAAHIQFNLDNPDSDLNNKHERYTQSNIG